jgi:hypothetical protein
MWAILVTALTASLLAAQTAGSAAGSAPAVSPRIEAFLQECETARRGAIIRLEYQLRGLRAEQQKSRAAAIARQIAKVEKDLSALRANQELVVPSLRFPVEVGTIGRLPRLTCHVDQVLSDNEMLVTCSFSLKVRAVEKRQPRYETVTRPVGFLVKGKPTSETHAGADLEMLDVFEVTGRHTYETDEGKSATVLVIEPFDMARVAKPRAEKTPDRTPPKS